MAAALHDSDAQAKRLALHDVLTGLPNRALFHERLTEAVAAARSGTASALHYIDLDRFKNVNDTLGHPSGDELIRQVDQRVSLLLGKNDTGRSARRRRVRGDPDRDPRSARRAGARRPDH